MELPYTGDVTLTTVCLPEVHTGGYCKDSAGYERQSSPEYKIALAAGGQHFMIGTGNSG